MEVGKDNFRNSLRIVSKRRLENLAKTSFEIVLKWIQWWRFGFEFVLNLNWKRVSPRRTRLVDCKVQMNRMRVYGVFIPSYGAIKLSSNRRAPADSRVCFRIIWLAWRREEWRFFRIIEVLQLSQSLTWNIFEDRERQGRGKFKV